MLDTSMKEQLKAYLDNLKRPVVLYLSLDDSDKSRELASLADDIASLSALVSVQQEEDGTSDRAPRMRVHSPDMNTSMSFAGLPMGHEFTSLVLALLHTGGHPIKEEEQLLEQARALKGEKTFEVFVSLSCKTCPEVVQALNLLAAVNPEITTTMIDGALFQEEVEARNILSVPTVLLNGEPFAQGRVKLTDILRKLDTASDAELANAMSAKEPYDMLVVGAGPAGASAAIYAARKGLRTGIVADEFGGQVAETLGIENFISVKATEGPKLVASLEEHVRDYDVDIMEGQRVNHVGERDEDGLVTVTTESGATLKARALLLATGARWRNINVPGEQEYKGHGVAYCPHCDGPLFKGKKVAVIGGGNSGIEAAIDLAGIVEHVTVLEFMDELKADQVLINKANSMPNIEIITNAQTLSIEGDGTRVNGLTYRDRTDDSEHQLELAGIFVQIGLIPNSESVKDRVEVTRFGEIVVDAKGQTSVPGIFAAGDVANTAYKQIVIAMGSGATASLGAFDFLIRQGQENTSDADTDSDTRAA